MRRFILMLLLAFFLMSPAICLSVADEAVHDGKDSGVWVDGTVVKAPYKTDFLRMKVDKVTYIIMSKCGIMKLVKTENGQYYQVETTLSEISAGEDISLKAQGNRVFRIIVQ